MNYYEHHIGDYAEATAHLSFVEDAAYSRLIRKYYALEGPLPADVRAVQRLICARTEEEREAVETILSEFFTLESDGWHQSRCDAEVERFRLKSDKARSSASKRWNATDNTPSNANASNKDANASKKDANALPMQSEGNAKAMPHAGAGARVPQSPDTSNQKEEKKRAVPALGVSDLVALGVSQSVAADWLKIRLAKRAPLTATAIEGLIRESKAAGMPVADTVRMCVERGWQGFKSEWIAGAQRPAINGQHSVVPEPARAPKLNLQELG